MKSVWIRIGLRYIAGFLVARGVVGEDMGDILATDPDLAAALQVAAGAVIAAATETYYKFAKKYGWPT